MRYSALLAVTGVLTVMLCASLRAQEKNAISPSGTYNPAVDRERAEQLNHLNSHLLTAKKDLEIAILKDKQRAQVELWTSLTITVLLISFLIIFLVIRHHKRRRKRLEAEKVLKDNELQETKTRLHHNVKLVDSFTQRILDKNKVIEELERKIRSNPLFNQSTEAAKKNLESISEIRILTHDDWEKFQSNINKVYPRLINRICDSFPLITDAELRMFLLIKLSVKNRDISEILGISPDSVRKTRFRLKKKLNLGEQDDLDDFITEYNGSNLPDEKLN